jgi:hypothetical protein
MRHEYKTDPDVFQRTHDGKKRAELRCNDRDTVPKEGDELLLRETVHAGEQMLMDEEQYPLAYTGRMLLVTVTDVLVGPKFGLRKGWLMLSHTAPFASQGGAP